MNSVTCSMCQSLHNLFSQIDDCGPLTSNPTCVRCGGTGIEPTTEPPPSPPVRPELTRHSTIPAKAERLFRAGAVRRVTDEHFVVTSSEPRDVRFRGGSWTCSCLTVHGRHSLRFCSHQDAVRLYLEQQAVAAR